MKILNAFAGIGGNRKLWDDCHIVTAVEIDQNIASVYHERYPKDKVVVGDAMQYIIDHYHDYDFIWASPPCHSHSKIRRMASITGQYAPVFPDMTLYSLILFLQNYYQGKYVVENVIPYYKPLIKPSLQLDRHLFWSNFQISHIDVKKDRIHQYVSGAAEFKMLGLNADGIKNKCAVIRSQVNYEVGDHILRCASDQVRYVQGCLFDGIE